MKTTPLLNDGLDGMPAKRVLNYAEKKKEEGIPIAGIYCGYAPIELMKAMDVKILVQTNRFPGNVLIKSQTYIISGINPIEMKDA